jgi:hypothetical protein
LRENHTLEKPMAGSDACAWAKKRLKPPPHLPTNLREFVAVGKAPLPFPPPEVTVTEVSLSLAPLDTPAPSPAAVRRGSGDGGEGSGGERRVSLVMVNYYAPGSLSVSDYDVYALRGEGEAGALNVGVLKRRFRLASVMLLDGTELYPDPSGCAEVRPFLNLAGDLDVTGVPLCLCGPRTHSDGDDDDTEAGGACAVQ